MADSDEKVLAAGQLKLPVLVRSPWWELARRLLLALAILVATVALVYFDRGSYRDNGDPTGGSVSLAGFDTPDARLLLTAKWTPLLNNHLERFGHGMQTGGQ